MASPRTAVIAATVFLARLAAAGAPGPTCRWTFDGAHPGATAHGAKAARYVTAGDVAGTEGKALALGVQRGDAAFLTAPVSPAIRLGPVYTLEAWVCPTNLAIPWQRLVLRWGKGGYAYHLGIRTGSTNTRGEPNVRAVSHFHCQADGTWVSVEAGTLVPDAWQHVAAVADGKLLRVYLDGVELHRVPYDGTIAPAGDEGLGIGESGSSRAPQHRFRGYLDEVALWSRALAPAEIAAHAATRSKPRKRVAKPLASIGQPILFVVRSQYRNEHGTEATMYQTGEINTRCFQGGGAIKLLDPATGKTMTLLDVPKGVAREPDVHFDGTKIVFSMRRDAADDYHIYEMALASRSVRQLTFGRRISDIQPIYLPNGQIAFSSTREPKYIPCQRHLMANLFVMNADGSNIRQLGHNTQFEGHASLMPDGRILYTRWEYVDKHYSSAYGLWTMNPDGTNQALYYGGYAWQPGAIVNGRVIPGTERFVAIYTAVHELPWGAMVVGDRRRGLDGTEPIVRSWPADVSRFMGRWDEVRRVSVGEFDSFRGVRIKYEDPYPLSEREILCSRWCPERKCMGLYLVDVSGGERLLHAEPPGCFDPRPVAPRKRPPVIPSRVDLERADGVFYVQDVYVGSGMERVRRGTVKWLRVVEAPAKLTWVPHGIGDWTPALNADGHHPIAVNWGHYNTKRILGRVPVEADGSAHFRVPAGRFVYFQLLDADEMMVQSMRSGTCAQPGETIGCVGCHDDRLGAAPAGYGVPTALRRAAGTIEPWYGPPREFSYTAEVQPVLDKHCIRCHDYGKKGAGKLLLCGDRGPAFSVSYADLRRRSPAVWEPKHAQGDKPFICSVDAGPVQVLPPYSWGSHRSRLVDHLRKGHEDVRLDKESLERIVTWIDLNTPYYPTHAAYYRLNTFGRCPLTHAQLKRLGELVAAAPRGKALGWTTTTRYSGGRVSHLIMTRGSPINFTRPERSLCLTAFTDTDSPAYREALGIIQAGQTLLAQHPRADTPGFRPCEADQRQLDYYAARRRIEARNREAICTGRTVFDTTSSARDSLWDRPAKP